MSYFHVTENLEKQKSLAIEDLINDLTKEEAFQEFKSDVQNLHMCTTKVKYNTCLAEFILKYKTKVYIYV